MMVGRRDSKKTVSPIGRVAAFINNKKAFNYEQPQTDRNQFWGDRTGRILDPSGHVWTISTRVEETSSAEREDRWASIVKG